MTIEAKSKILGIPFLTREISHKDGDMWLGIQKEVASEGENQFTPRTFRVLSDDQLAVSEFYPEANDPKIMKRGKTMIYTKQQINDANIHTSGTISRVHIRWRTTQ